jgi:hypothetical protein
MNTQLKNTRHHNTSFQNKLVNLLFALCTVTYFSAFVLPYIESIAPNKTEE